MNLFKKSWQKLRDQRVDFNAFRKIVAEKAKPLAEANPLFQSLESHFSFYVDENVTSDTIQIWFGKRHMGRQNHLGESAVESGASLVYSYGPTGDVLTILTPCSSNVAKTAEDHIYLRRGSYGIVDLDAFLTTDISDLVTYCAVSSLDAKAPLLAEMRIGWLRLTASTTRDNAYKRPSWQYWLISSLGAAVKGGISAIFKIVGPLGLLAGLALFGLKGCDLYEAIDSKIHTGSGTVGSLPQEDVLDSHQATP